MATNETLRRRRYHQAYYRRNKLAALSTRQRWLDAQRHPCPGVGEMACGVMISRFAKHCHACATSGHYKRKNPRRKADREAVKSLSLCPACRGKMQPRIWHEVTFLRCGSCGWEISPREMRRINFENRLKTGARELAAFLADAEAFNVAA